MLTYVRMFQEIEHVRYVSSSTAANSSLYFSLICTRREKKSRALTEIAEKVGADSKLILISCCMFVGDI
jgi:hypothetical protein